MHAHIRELRGAEGVVDVPVGEHHGQRQLGQRGDEGRQVAHAVAGVDQQRPLVPSHQVHESVVGALDASDARADRRGAEPGRSGLGGIIH